MIIQSYRFLAPLIQNPAGAPGSGGSREKDVPLGSARGFDERSEALGEERLGLAQVHDVEDHALEETDKRKTAERKPEQKRNVWSMIGYGRQVLLGIGQCVWAEREVGYLFCPDVVHHEVEPETVAWVAGVGTDEEVVLELRNEVHSPQVTCKTNRESGRWVNSC